MASAHIEVVGAAGRHNRALREFLEQLQRTQDQVDRLKATYDQLALGSDWVALAEALSHTDPTYAHNIDATDAETIYNLIGSVQTELHGTFITHVLGRLG
jgi:tRNA A37 N6-isopentenylltransferase MiaA